MSSFTLNMVKAVISCTSRLDSMLAVDSFNDVPDSSPAATSTVV
jgi:hypothetical protein